MLIATVNDVTSPDVTRDESGYVALESYAAIGDGRTVALIARDGRIDWLPLPDLDSSPVFAGLLDAEHGGHIALAPIEDYRVERAYSPGTNVLVTTFTTAGGSARVIDSMNTGIAGRLPWAEVARRIEGITGQVRLRAAVVPGTCLNTTSPWAHTSRDGDALLHADSLMLAVRTLAAESVDLRRSAVDVEYRTEPGSRHLLGIVASHKEPLYLPSAEDIDAGVDRTIENWAAWLAAFDWDGPWADAVQRSALLLKLLIYAPTGAIAAAATTSLPESATGGKNWDYRFAWVRDMAYTLTALFRFGLREEIHAAMSWLLTTIRAHGPHPRIFYTLDGRQEDGELTERDVPGWRGIGPVVVGNGAIDQLQLGVFGDLFSIARLWVDNGNVLDAWTSRTLAVVADTACDTWRSKDAGMWELQQERHYTTSKMGCWKALHDAVHLAEAGEIGGDVERWRNEAETLREWIEENCWSEPAGAYVFYPGTDQLDASVLLHAISGYARGERMSRTLDALRDRLGRGPHLYRYSGMDKEENAFVACSFWMVSALQLCGREDEARALMDALVPTANDVGVLSEMVDPDTGQFWGNLPQGLSHLALMHAAITIAAGPDETSHESPKETQL